MSTLSKNLPHISPNLFLTDGGLETTLVFLEGYDLPCFAAFDLLKDEKGTNAIKNYYRRYLNIARDYKTGFILESPTWRANPDWISKIGYPETALTEVNRKAVDIMISLKDEFKYLIPEILISGCVGPRGDGYTPENKMTAEQARDYHSHQLEVFAGTPVDLVSAITMNYVEEAIGIVRAANALKLPAVISFTVETDGRLYSGMSLKEAIEQVDTKVDEPPVYFVINCAHPTHFISELHSSSDRYWTQRIRGIRANASCKSHAELDEATELDRGNPGEFGSIHKKLKDEFTHLNVFGGCCGTDEEHVRSIINGLISV